MIFLKTWDNLPQPAFTRVLIILIGYKVFYGDVFYSVIRQLRTE